MRDGSDFFQSILCRARVANSAKGDPGCRASGVVCLGLWVAVATGVQYAGAQLLPIFLDLGTHVPPREMEMRDGSDFSPE